MDRDYDFKKNNKPAGGAINSSLPGPEPGILVKKKWNFQGGHL